MLGDAQVGFALTVMQVIRHGLANQARRSSNRHRLPSQTGSRQLSTYYENRRIKAPT